MVIEKDKFLEYVDNLGEYELRSLVCEIYGSYLTYEDVQGYLEMDL